MPGVVPQCVVVVALLLLALPLHADVGLILSDSTGQGASRYTSAGHSAVYLSNICADGPVHLRPCHADEHGSVMTNYKGFSEDQDYEWNVVPASIFFYGLENAEDRPLFASESIRYLLQQRYLHQALGSVCVTEDCQVNPNAHWRDTVAETFLRTVYIFSVTTTEAQDRAFLAKWNNAPNREHFNGFTNNCADFAARVMNSFYPGALRRNYWTDFAMMSPKSAARSMVHYARRHPELHYRATSIPQIPSAMPRSHQAREGTETVFYQKKWLLPLLAIHGNELPICAVSYLVGGRFSPAREARESSGEDTTALPAYRERYKSALRAAAQQGQLAPAGVESTKEEDGGKRLTGRVFTTMNTGTASLDAEGRPWVGVHLDGTSAYVGVTERTLLAQGSDPRLAYALMLARVGAVLRSGTLQRGAIDGVDADWALLQQAHSALQGAENRGLVVLAGK